jgi:SAM-dependent MidA family methyltransferase
LAAALGERLARSSGAALFVDYGYFPSRPGPTLSALCHHRPVNVFDNPGDADLSAHVDFAAFAEAARAAGGAIWGPMPQGRFLAALGGETRLAALSTIVSPEQRALLESGLRRLIDPAEMGTLFKVMAVTSPGLPAPAGFAETMSSEGE